VVHGKVTSRDGSRDDAGGEISVVVWTERDGGERLIFVRQATAKARTGIGYPTLTNEALAQYLGAAEKPITAEQRHPRPAAI
jgi:hypothetical protein